MVTEENNNERGQNNHLLNSERDNKFLICIREYCLTITIRVRNGFVTYVEAAVPSEVLIFYEFANIWNFESLIPARWRICEDAYTFWNPFAG